MKSRGSGDSVEDSGWSQSSWMELGEEDRKRGLWRDTAGVIFEFPQRRVCILSPSPIPHSPDAGLVPANDPEKGGLSVLYTHRHIPRNTLTVPQCTRPQVSDGPSGAHTPDQHLSDRQARVDGNTAHTSAHGHTDMSYLKDIYVLFTAWHSPVAAPTFYSHLSLSSLKQGQQP